MNKYLIILFFTPVFLKAQIKCNYTLKNDTLNVELNLKKDFTFNYHAAFIDTLIPKCLTGEKKTDKLKWSYAETKGTYSIKNDSIILNTQVTDKPIQLIQNKSSEYLINHQIQKVIYGFYNDCGIDAFLIINNDTISVNKNGDFDIPSNYNNEQCKIIWKWTSNEVLAISEVFIINDPYTSNIVTFQMPHDQIWCNPFFFWINSKSFSFNDKSIEIFQGERLNKK